MATLNHEDLVGWINLLYKELLKKDILIGGYLFTLSQLDLLKSKINQTKSKMKLRNNFFDFISKLDLQEIYSNDKIIKFAPKLLKDCPGTALAIEINVRRKDGTKTSFPIMIEECELIVTELEKKQKAIDHFKLFCLNELQSVEDISVFQVFVNDFYSDILTEIST